MYAWVDLETTGLDASRHEITEVALITTDPSLREISRWHALVRPSRPDARAIADPVGLALTGYDFEPRAGEIDQRACAHQLAERLDGLTVCGHYVAFDRSFINATLKRHGFDRPRASRRGIDTKVIAEAWRAQGMVTSTSLSILSSELDLCHDHPHSAMSDIEATLGLARILWPAMMRAARKHLE